MTQRSLSPLTYDAPLRPANNLGTPGELKWLSPDRLVIDTRYQRDVGGRGKQNIRQIIENFEWAMFSPLIVSPRSDGVYAVIDGQHRAIAALTHGGIGDLPCYVISANQAKQAKAFAVINGQVTAVHPLAMFRARVAAEDVEALAIIEVAQAAGVTVLDKAKTSSAMQPGETQSANTIGTCLTRYGRDVTLAALNCITKTGNEKGMLIEPVIGSLAEVLWRAAKWRNHPELHAALRARGLRNLYTRALQMMAETGGSSVRKKLPDVIIAALTERLGPCTLGPAYIAGPKVREALARGRKLGTAAAARKKHEARVSKDAEILRREQGVIAAKTRQSPAAKHDNYRQKVAGSPKAVAPDTRALIDQHIAKKGVRKLDSGASTDSLALLTYLQRKGYQIEGGQKFMFRYRGKLIDLNALIDLVDKERVKDGLAPLKAKTGKAA